MIFVTSRAISWSAGRNFSGWVYWIPLLRLNLGWLRYLPLVNRYDKAKPYLCPHSRNSHEGRDKRMKNPKEKLFSSPCSKKLFSSSCLKKHHEIYLFSSLMAIYYCAYMREKVVTWIQNIKLSIKDKICIVFLK